MKCFYLLGILLLEFYRCLAVQGPYTEINELIEKKCKQAGGEDTYKNLIKVLHDVKICLGGHLLKISDALMELKDSSEGSSEEICTDKRKKVLACFSHLRGAWQGCSEPAEKYLPHFVFDAIEAVLDYICADETGFIEKIFNSFECVDALMENEDFTDGCINELKFLKDDTPEDITVTKEELCQDLATANTCFGAYIDKHCRGSDFKALVGGIYNAVRFACYKRHRRSL